MNDLASGALLGSAVLTRLDTAVEQAITALGTEPDSGRRLGRATELLAEALPGGAVGILVDEGGSLRVAAAASASLSGLMCVDAACSDSPAHVAYRTGSTVSSVRLPAFPAFGAAAMDAGLRMAWAVPIATGASPMGVLLALSPSTPADADLKTTTLQRLADAIAQAIPADDTTESGPTTSVPRRASATETDHEPGGIPGRMKLRRANQP